MTVRDDLPVFGVDSLNRATLARQGLLDRVDVDPVTALETFGGLQAQEPASPYLALWTRLRSFEAADLERAFHERRAVKATLMRITLHAVSSRDYRLLLPALLPMLRVLRRRGWADRPEAPRVSALVEAVEAFAATPRGNTEIRELLGGMLEGLVADDVWWLVRRQSTLVHVPDGVPWAFGRRPMMITADAWLTDDGFAEETAALEHLVRRYLGAFGPATAADISQWAGLSMAAAPAGDRCGRGTTSPRCAGTGVARRGRRATARSGDAGATTPAADVGQHPARVRRPDTDRVRRGSCPGHRPERGCRADVPRRWAGRGPVVGRPRGRADTHRAGAVPAADRGASRSPSSGG